MNVDEVIAILKSLAGHDPKDLEGMSRYGINISRTLGVVPTPAIKRLAKELGKDHSLAVQLWAAGFRETRVLAAMIDDPAEVTSGQMDNWVADFDSWDVCDATCLYLFSWTALAIEKAVTWSKSRDEFVKRAGFVLMACLAVGKRKATDKQLEAFLPIIERESFDERNFVKKAVNWALRQIGKRNAYLNRVATQTCERIRQKDTKSARWIASDALREITGDKVKARLNKKAR